MKPHSNSPHKHRKTLQEEFKENYCNQNYHYLERAPFSQYTDQPFTFDDSPNRTRKLRETMQFIKFDKNASCHVLAKDILQQNNDLKERLRQSENLIYQLESELEMYRNEVQSKEAELLRERAVFEKKMSEFRNEIVAIMLSNKKLQGELASLRHVIQEKPLGRANRSNIKSLDRLKDNKAIVSHSYQSSLQNKKIEELMDSIRNMHLKIMGFRTDNLKDLWRWLKSIGQTYSCLRKWREQYADVNPYSRNDRIRQALWEVFEMID